MEITLIFPDQLFKTHPAVSKKRPIYLIEEFLYFKYQSFHKQRLILLRAAMQHYYTYLQNHGFKVNYIHSRMLLERGSAFHLLAKENITAIHLAEFNDDWLKIDLESSVKKYKWTIHYYPSPMFLCSENEIRAFLKEKKRYSMANFYAYQRKKLNILMENGFPVGGKYSFDMENRKKIPKNYPIPPLSFPKQNKTIKEVALSIDQDFPDAIGESLPFLYPTTFEEAENSLQDFINYRLYDFGTYEDAIKEDQSFLFHSVLSPLLNIGLLTPQQILDQVISSYDKLDIPLNSLEGFIRQIVGWREFMRGCYLIDGRRERTLNFFNHHNHVPKGFWNGTTGIRPVDSTIKKVLKTGYCHHIERLMILGNFLLLTETHPNKVYHWFMSYFVDAYDWVMVPNVYAMSQFAEGGKLTTKPYISGSNYIFNMSDYPKEDWCEVWDGLFWRFISKNSHFFKSNPRSKMLLNMIEKNKIEISKKIDTANSWLQANL